MPNKPLLQVEDLRISFRGQKPDPKWPFRSVPEETMALDGIDIEVNAGEIVAVIGASGSGKTLLADALFGLFERNARASGSISFDGTKMDAESLVRLRGRGMSLVPQGTSHLDPLMKAGKQTRGKASDGRDRKRRLELQKELFERYGLGRKAEDLYPHELSGGMARRVLLACALEDEPRLIVADEPTPGLELQLAESAMDDLRSFTDAGGGVLLITHDIELALRSADRIAIVHDGKVADSVSSKEFLSGSPLAHPFSRKLWSAVFGEHDPRAYPPAPSPGERAILEAHGITFSYPGRNPVLENVGIQAFAGERVAVEAPSGKGKTTLCKILAGHLRSDSGTVLIDGEPLPRKGLRPVQLIGQHPEKAVDPRMRIRAILEEAGALDASLCRTLGIQESWMGRRPHELSGGELQRCCIARALAAKPRCLLCDETTAMLDAVSQEEIWKFLSQHAAKEGMAIVLTTHSRSLLKRIATRTVKL